MNYRIALSALALGAAISSTSAQIARSAPAPALAPSGPPIVNAAPEQKQIMPKIPDGGIPPVVGVQNIQVYRATTSIPDSLDDRGWTYNHHVDMAIWRGHYLLAFTNGQKDEDVWPSREMLTESADGLHWAQPESLFPPGVSTSLRTYFYHASNNRMLAIAGLRINTDKLDEATKGGLVVREIFMDLKPGDVFTLQAPPKGQAMKPYPSFETSADKGLVAACRELLANHTFLEQQDFGTLLGANRMAVYKGANKNFGKALNFFHRKDGALVGISKNGFTIVSTDEGKTWTPPVIPPTLLTNNAKVWVQKTSDDRYAMVYNPTGRDRFPLVMTTSDDGITFDTMRVVQGEVPPQRYPGLNKNIGAQYVRGASIFANDGSRKDDKDMIVAYSMNKEDLWVSRIPVPSKAPDALPIADRFDAPAVPGVLVPNWNIYCPQWASVQVVTKENENKRTIHYLELQDRDPFDYVRADRIFRDSKIVHIMLSVSRGDDPRGELDIELSPTHGIARPVRLVLTANKHLTAVTGKTTTDFGEMDSGWQSIGISADCATGTFSLAFGNQSVDNLPFAEPADALARLTLRTGPYRTVPAPATVAVEGDKPIAASIFRIQNVQIK